VNEPPPTQPEAEQKPPANIKVRVADGKERQLQQMAATSFWSADGRPMSAAQFLESLFGALPEFFKDEDELDADKLSPLLKLKYRTAIAYAFAELGRPDQVRRVFVGFQRHMYSA
jgi:hypothetical protein